MGDTNFRLPNNSQRLAVIGRTGSGKTQFGMWVLSLARFDLQPYVMIDYKGDDLIGSLDKVQEIDFRHVPEKPGLYVIRPLPSQDAEMENWLWRVWEREHVGLYIDEGYCIPEKGAFQAVLTQGRSKRIPVICLSQRPSWLSRFVFSEADFYAVFSLNDRKDQLRVQEFTPKERMNLKNRLSDYHAYYYDVGNDNVFQLMPVPAWPEIRATIESRLVTKRRLI